MNSGLAVGIAAGAAAGAAVRQIHSFDVFWYLRSGEEIIAQRGLPAVDRFSYTSAQPWMNHEWLAQVVMALVHRAGGVVLLGLLVAAGMGLSLYLLARRAAAPAPAVLAVCLAGALIGANAEPRALVFAHLLFAVALVVAANDADKPGPWLFLLPFIQIALTNLHGGNPMVVAVAVAALTAGVIRAPRDLREHYRRGGVAITTAIATLAGPYGWHVHGHWLGAKSTLPEIREWQPLGAVLADGSIPHWIFLALVVLAAWTRIRSREARPRFDDVAFVLFVLGGLLYVRLCVEAALVCVLVVARHGDRLPRFPMGAAAGAGLAALVLSVVMGPRALGFGLAPGRFPVAAVSWLKSHPELPGPMFNSFNHGGYLIWEMPERQVFIDGRAHTIYTDEHIRQLVEVYKQPELFRELERRWGFRLAIMARTGRGAKLLEYLALRGDWKLAYGDPTTVVLVKP